jgi:putative chitinase
MKLATFANGKKVISLDELNADEELCKDFQAALTKAGYLDHVDGVCGPKTKAAFIRFKLATNQGEPKLLGPGSAKLLIDLAEQVGKIPSADEINWKNPAQRICKYFTVNDVTKGDPRRIPRDANVINNILRLAKELDEVREAWGGPIGVTSWYRPPAVNRAVGGVSNSQHINGSAADIYPVGKDIYQFQKWLDGKWDKALGYGAKKGFCHLDLRPGRIRWNY